MTVEELAKMTKLQLQKLVIELINANLTLQRKVGVEPIDKVYENKIINGCIAIIEEHNLNEATRRQEVVFKRHAVRWFLRQNTKLKHREIATLTNSIEHSTINHSVAVHERLIETKDEVYIDCIADIMNQLNNLKDEKELDN